jgi:long-chain fatty acid transport protein
MLITCVAVLILGPVLALANGFYSPTVGPRASAMGGAFIGLADDYSAVYWNPAGITQIKGMELTATGQDVVSLASRDGYVRYYGETEERYAMVSLGATSETLNRIAPGVFFFSDAGPLRSVFDKVGVAGYTLTEYGSKWNADDVLNGADFVNHEPTHDFTGKYLDGDMQDYESRIKTYVFSPVFAKEVVPGLSVGLTANIAYSHFTVRRQRMGLRRHRRSTLPRQQAGQRRNGDSDADDDQLRGRLQREDEWGRRRGRVRVQVRLRDQVPGVGRRRLRLPRLSVRWPDDDR